jgi:hypothetical protein
MGPEERPQLIIAFRAAPSASAAQASSNAAGSLTLTAVYLLVDEFKLEGNEDACEAPGSPPDCARFEAEPRLLALPLVAGLTSSVIEQSAPQGTFTQLKFETKAGNNAEVQSQISAARITDWPSAASLLIIGTFAPAGATAAEDFRVFFDAEVKIILPLPDPLVIANETEGEQRITVNVDPYIWFPDPDLRGLDFAATGGVHKLEVKLEQGFTKVEVASR